MQNIGKVDEPCTDLLKEFSILCINFQQQNMADEIVLTHLSQKQARKVKVMVKNYQPRRNVESTVRMKLPLTDELPVYQHPRSLAYCGEKLMSGLTKTS